MLPEKYPVLRKRSINWHNICAIKKEPIPSCGFFFIGKKLRADVHRDRLPLHCRTWCTAMQMHNRLWSMRLHRTPASSDRHSTYSLPQHLRSASYRAAWLLPSQVPKFSLFFSSETPLSFEILFFSLYFIIPDSAIRNHKNTKKASYFSFVKLSLSDHGWPRQP